MAEEKKVPVITVHTKATDRQVILFERDPAHPTGEVFLVNNGKNYQVAETPGIRRLLAEDRLFKGEASEENVAATPQPPGRRPGRVMEPAPELRPATEGEEKRARPPLVGDTEKDTSRVPRRE